MFISDELDSRKKESVKKKTNHYLQRAEQLMARLTRKDKKKCQVSIFFLF